MYNCFNQAIQYLKDKLGTEEISFGYNTRNSKKITNSVYLVKNIVPNSVEHSIHLLLTQYNYGIEAKKELYYKLINLGVEL